jgi:hypothetical protein
LARNADTWHRGRAVGEGGLSERLLGESVAWPWSARLKSSFATPESPTIVGLLHAARQFVLRHSGRSGFIRAPD